MWAGSRSLIYLNRKVFFSLSFIIIIMLQSILNSKDISIEMSLLIPHKFSDC